MLTTSTAVTSKRHSPSTIAIIGGGFSGSMVAVHLLQQSKHPIRIKLIERAPEAGRGVAYSTPVQSHLLNVPAGKMSAFPDHPEHFLQWLQSRQQLNIGTIHAGMFAPRSVYGDYLQSILQEAASTVESPARLERVTAEAVSIEEFDRGAFIHLNTGETVRADKVVLALGNFPSHFPVPVKQLNSTPAAVKEAWSWEATDNLDPDDPVLLVGTGLTMVDTVITLRQQGHRGRIYAVSRHGLLPQRHQTVESHDNFLLSDRPQTIRALVRRVREEIQTSGKDWRAVIDALRPITQDLWQNLPLKEQQRFLRHVKSYWEVHRHRIAPKIATVLDELLQTGQLRYYAGRVLFCQETNQEIAVTIRQRGTIIHSTLHVRRIVNCTGSNANYRNLQHPLVASLQEQQLIRSSALRMGIDTTENGAVIDADGCESGWLFTLGTALKGKLWETVAVPELREQAQSVAKTLLESLSVRPYVEQPKLIFRQLFDRDSCTYTYLIADPQTKQAILVDPVLEQLDRDLQILRELDLVLRYCVETHVHADHITGAGQLRSRTGCRIIVPEGAPVNNADYKIAHAEILRLGRLEMIAIATPGHTDSHMAYLINEAHLLTGDALFIRGCGRTDFQGGAAEQLYDAVTQKLFNLPDETFVYPGHDYHGRTVSTIGEEKRWNLRFANRERSEFIELMGALKLPYPKKMRQAVPANELCGVVPSPPQSPPDSANLLNPDPRVFAGMYI